MSNEPSWEEIESLYYEVLEASGSERKVLLSGAGSALRAEVESLFEAESQSSLLTTTPTHLAADLIDGQPGGLATGERVGDYEVKSLISIGGMGEVYLARDSQGNPVALKILRRHLIVSGLAVDRFETEARAASALCHPNIVTVYESGRSEVGMFIAMEWLEGSTFRSVINAGQVKIKDVIDWGAQAAAALASAHHARILHRDIKPENIMLIEDFRVVKILDFGLARYEDSIGSEVNAIGAAGTISGTLSGTLLYMAPEILRGEPATTASDVFSLGTVLYELATGRHPFAGETQLDVFEAIELRPVAEASSLRSEIPRELDLLLLQMLCRNTSLRPSAADVFQTLQEI